MVATKQRYRVEGYAIFGHSFVTGEVTQVLLSNEGEYGLHQAEDVLHEVGEFAAKHGLKVHDPERCFTRLEKGASIYFADFVRKPLSIKIGRRVEKFPLRRLIRPHIYPGYEDIEVVYYYVPGATHFAKTFEAEGANLDDHLRSNPGMHSWPDPLVHQEYSDGLLPPMELVSLRHL